MNMDGKLSRSAADAVDYKGFPADRTKTGGWIPAALILVIEICERLSTMGIAVNLITYLGSTMHLPISESANIVSDFMGTSFQLSLLGGFLADSFLGRYLTVAIFAAIQSLGTGLLSISTRLPQLHPPPCNLSQCEPASGFQMGVLYLSLYVIALGTGGLKSSVSGFGTDQFDDKDEKEKTQMAFFFNRFFFFISTGTLLAVTVLVYIQDHVSRSLAYGICCASMVLAILVFVSGTKRYRYKKSSGSPIVHILQVVVAAVMKRKLKYPSTIALLYEDCPEVSRINHSDQFRFLDKAAIIEEGENGGASRSNPWRLCSVTRIEEVKMMIRLLPVWATTNMFWTIYAQIITFSIEQATSMERNIGTFQIPAGSLTVFFVGAILVTLGFYDRVIMPLWRKWKGKPGFTNLQRMGIGLVFSVVGMAAAAVAEKRRLTVARSFAGSGVAPRGTTLPISVFTLIPQFLLVGAGEAFIYTGQLDFFLTRSPKGMKTMSTGLFLTTISLGFFVSSFLVSMVKGVTGWLADNINEGRLDCFYGLLAVLGTLNLGVYLVCAAWSNPVSSKDGIQMESGHIVKTASVDDKC